MKNLQGKDYVLGIQHLFAMFGATVLVPLFTGLNVSLALASAGFGTLIFHLVTKGKVPVFLGSSFAFIGPIASVVATKGIASAQGGIMAAGLLYLVFALVVFYVGADAVKKLFPPVVTGPVIIVIGVGLSYSAINNTGLLRAGLPAAQGGIDWIISLFVLCLVVGISVFSKGFFKLVPILLGIAGGYLLCIALSACGLFQMDYTAIINAPWVNIPFVSTDANGVGFFSLPAFDLTAIMTIAPVALVTFMEHIGDITTNGAVVGKDFFKNPGLHRTLLGDGLATAFAGLIGGPPNTTYSENTGVLATTRNYNPALLRLAALFAIALAFLGKFGAILTTIPTPVRGGVEVVLYGMIAAIGIRTLAESKLDFTHSRNLIIVALILVMGLGITIATYVPELGTNTGILVTLGGNTFGLSGLFVATVAGVLANMVLPLENEEEVVETKA